MVSFTKEEKREMSNKVTQHLPRIRKLLGVTQAEFGDMCGFSRTRVSQIENGAIKMTWSQLTSILFVCMVNYSTKEYLYANNIMDIKFLQFIQRKDENIPPDTNINVREEIVNAYKNRIK